MNPNEILFWLLTMQSAVVSFDENINHNVDASTEFVVLPSRGLLFERTGTIFSYPQMNLMTVVISLEPLAYDKTLDNNNCWEALTDVERRFNSTMKKYKTITDAVFQAKHIFSTDEVCRVFSEVENYSDVCSPVKSKRLVAVGAYIMAASSLAVAISAAGLATSNKIEIEKIRRYLNEHEQQILQLQNRLKYTNDKLDIVIDTQSTMLGYVESISTRVDALNTKVDCMFKYFSYLDLAKELQLEVENLLQFIFQGQNHGRLTPRLIKPDLLRKFIEEHSVINSKVLGKYPNMLYQTAMASLIDVDFEYLQFTFLLTYPDFGNDPIYPFFTLRQNGFWASFPSSNESSCFMYDMPETAVIHNNQLHVLHNALHCPNFGNVRICSQGQFQMTPMSECIATNLTNNSSTTSIRNSPCKLNQCVGGLNRNNSYISSSPGLLIRTSSPRVDIIYGLPQKQLELYVSGTKIQIPTPESGALFIPWLPNISAISFTNVVVYSPVNFQHRLRISVSTDNRKAKLDLNSFLSVPSLGTERLTQIIESQQKRLKELENGLEPSFNSIKQWASQAFTIPLWLKVVVFSTIVVGVLAVCRYLFNRIRRYALKCSSSGQNTPQNPVVTTSTNPQYTVLQDLTPNSLYPTLPQAPVPLTLRINSIRQVREITAPNLPPRMQCN